VAADAGYHRALLVGSILMAAAALLALRIGNTRKAAPLVMVSTELPPEPSRAAAGPVTGYRPAQRHLYPDK
jgi:fructose-specific component phosphotransferase system IIB-like protein